MNSEGVCRFVEFHCNQGLGVQSFVWGEILTFTGQDPS